MKQAVADPNEQSKGAPLNMIAAPLAGRWCALRRPNPVFSPEYQALVQVLISVRRRSGVSQRELASRLCRSPSHVARIEAGERRVDLLEAFRIADALDLLPAELFADLTEALRAAAGVDPPRESARSREGELSGADFRTGER